LYGHIRKGKLYVVNTQLLEEKDLDFLKTVQIATPEARLKIASWTSDRSGQNIQTKKEGINHKNLNKTLQGALKSFITTEKKSTILCISISKQLDEATSISQINTIFKKNSLPISGYLPNYFDSFFA
jgi:hypothetical protein